LAARLEEDDMDLQTTWFLLIGVLLIGYAILDGFDLGVGMLHNFIAKKDEERRILINSIGPVWDGNEVWLLTGGGAIFAAFPPVYATVFSGFYIALMLLLAALIFRAVSLEFRSKEPGATWRKSWDVAFGVGSFLPALLFGVAIGNIVRGIPIGPDGEYAGTFFTLLNPFAIMLGLLSTAMFVMQGAAWLMVRTEGELRARAQKAGVVATVVTIALWAMATAFSRVAAPHTWNAYANPVFYLVPLTFVVFGILTFVQFRKGASGLTFLFSSLAVTAVVGLVGVGLYPYMVPALGNLDASLTIHNSSSSQLTLKTMLYIALGGVPIVLAYTIFIYSKFFGPVQLHEHSY
jgi:cytochrome bd ubiquinol oxidase subunit II